MVWISLAATQTKSNFWSPQRNMVLFYSLVVALAVIGKVSASPFVVSPSPTQATNYQKWAHYHWVWLKNSDGNQANETAFIQGYKDNNIPVGALNIDSTWATQFNNFIVDTTRFPDFKGMVSNFHDQGIKVILWATSMVNTDNPDYQMCVDNQYLIRNSHGVVRPLEWWHGSGGLLDYTNPEALKWWHAQMDLVLDAGVDGFKCDGTDPYIDEYTLTGGALGYNDKVITYREYANSYYRDFFDYTRAKRSENVPGADAGLIMSRPVDCLLDGVSKACTPFSPYNVMYSGWMGDDDSSFLGLRACAHKVIYSAWLGYGNYGCDVGGYRGGSDTKYATHFLRSAQLNAFLPLMENGGGGEHRPWMYEESYVVPVYRKFVQQHYRLSAYLLTNGANAVDTNSSAIHPLDYRTIADIADFSLQQQQQQEKAATTQSAPSRDAVTNDFLNAQRLQKQNPAVNKHDDHNIHIVFPNPKTLAYLLGQDILVHPVMYDQDNRTASAVVHVEFPELSSVLPDTKEASGTVWLDWWSPSVAKKQHAAGTSATVVVPIETFPVYVRKGAFIPLHPVRAVRTVDTEVAAEVTEEAQLLTQDAAVDLERVLFTWFAPSTAHDADHPVIFVLRESISEGTGMVAKASFTTADTLVATISAHRGSLGAGVSFVGVTEPSEVTVDAWPDSRCVHTYTQHTSTFAVSCASVAGGLKVTLSGVKSTL